MDYKKLIAAIRLCGSTPGVEQCKKCVYWEEGDIYRCIPKMTAEAAEAITELLAYKEQKEIAVNPFEDDDPYIECCGICKSGEYLRNEDGNRNVFCGQCGQKINWDALDALSDGEERKGK